jgi:hypothetical protein
MSISTFPTKSAPTGLQQKKVSTERKQTMIECADPGVGQQAATAKQYNIYMIRTVSGFGIDTTGYARKQGNG